MTIILTKEQEAFVTERMSQLGFTSPQEMIDAAFRLFEERSAEPEIPLEIARQLVREGVDALNAGRYRTFNSGDEVADSVIAAARRKAGL